MHVCVSVANVFCVYSANISLRIHEDDKVVSVSCHVIHDTHAHAENRLRKNH